MEDFNSKYTGQQVEDLLDQVASGNAVETDPIFSASPAASITDADKVAWNNKVDYANKSLSIVGADGFMTSEGEGFVLPNTPAAQGEHGLVLATLDDIPDELTESDIAAMGFTKNEGTITEVKMNGESKGTGGVVDLGNVITEHQDISGKQDKISDLDNIRSGAEKGATALQASDVDSEMSEVSTNPIQNKTFSQAFMQLIEEFGLALESKQDNITDLQTIREGAAKGATAVQPGDIQDEVYITDFDVLSLESLVQNREEGIVIDKQGLMDALAIHKVILVPYEISDNVTAKGYCTLVGYYEDLLYIKVIAEYKEIIVETSLNYPDIYCQEVTLRWWADKQDALVSGNNIKTINGESILGSGNITIAGGSGEKGDKGDKGDTGATGVGVQSVKQTTISNTDGGSNVVTVTLTNGTTSTFTVKNGSKGSNGTNGKDGTDGATFTPSVDSAGNLSWTNNKGLSNPPTVNIKGPKGDKGDSGSGGGGSSSGSGAYAEVNHGTSDTTFTLTPNTFHVWDEVSALTLTLGGETSGFANEFIFQFTSGATATTLTLPDDIKWANELTIEPNMIYQVSILKGLASVLEFSNAAALIDNLCTYDGSKTVTFQYPVDSDVTVSVAGKTVQISKGEMSVSFSGIGEPMGKITGIVPPFDKTYNYIY